MLIQVHEDLYLRSAKMWKAVKLVLKKLYIVERILR